MKFTHKIQKAINTATRLHTSINQRRKGSDLPYIVHPFSVAMILSAYTDDEDVIVAGLLHDILEDVPGYNIGDMERDFGKKVALLVKGVSEDKDPNIKTDAKATWEDRKRGYLAHLETASQDSLMITAADKIQNLNSMADDYKEKGDALWAQFNSPVGRKLWLYHEMLKTLKRRLKSPIVKEMAKAYAETEKAIVH
jgi:(p)ppGpp synthase/HD superfamily hydrolase